MFKKRSKIGAGAVCLVTAAAISLAADTPRAADDHAKPVPANPIASPAPSDNVTRSITVRAPLVVVRANPGKSREANVQGTQSPSGQYAFLDAQGNLTSLPQPGTQVPAVPARGPAASAPYRDPAVDPHALFADTSHIRAAVVARVNANGQIEMTCQQHTDSPGHTCEAGVVHAPAAGAPESARESIKEDR